MRGRIAWITGSLGLAAVVLFRRVSRRRPAGAEPAPPPDLRAEELRRKLAEARTMSTEREEFESAETTVDRAEPLGDLEDRRRRVRERGEATVDEMRRSTPDE